MLAERHSKLVRLANALQAAQMLYDKAYDQYVEEYRKWQEKNPNAPGPKPKPEKLLPAQIVLGVERIYQGRLRASAAAALGRIDHDQSRRALRQALAQGDDDYSDLHKGFAIMSLGQLGDPQALGLLAGLLRPTRDGRIRKTSAKLKSPLRGYAALALGLYARPVRTPQGLQDRPEYDNVCRALAERLADGNETMEVRSAAALALGLTGRSENLRLLQPASGTIQPQEEVLAGYVLLARGMLGDKNILSPAKRFLAVANDRLDTSGMLARRAAVLGLGVLGNEQGIPTLIDAWWLSYYVNREVPLAFSLCEAHAVTPALIAMVKNSKNGEEQAYAARCLGELLARARPRRLSRLIAGSNYAMKNLRMIRFQSLANEFLFVYLIPCFGEDWR